MADQGMNPTVDRRKFLTVLGVTGGGAAALSGCSTARVEKLIPYLVQSEDQVPGVPTWYASTCTECAAGCGVHVKTREGRAIKLEGNPEHPVNGGRLCSLGQSALQGLYNPGRVKGPMERRGDGFAEITWDQAITRLAAEVTKATGRVAVISGAGQGTFSDLLAEFAAAAGGSVARYDTFDHEPLRTANRQVFGTDKMASYDFGAARYILSFGADFLESWGNSMENQRGFARSHGFSEGTSAKHVYFGPRGSLTALNADEFHPIRPGSEAVLVRAITGLVGGAGGSDTPESAAAATGVAAAVITRIAREFAAAQPGLAVAGGPASQHRGAVEVCAAVNALNAAVGNVGRTIRFGDEQQMGDGYQAIARLQASIDGGQVGLLLVHAANPAYTLPKASGFAEQMRKVPFKVSTSLYMDETAMLCDLLIPNHHALERWDDARPRAGLLGLMQPVMEPVFKTMPTGDVLLKTAQKIGGAFAGFTAPSYEAYLKDAWRGLGGADFETYWRAALARGGVYQAASDDAAPSIAPQPAPAAAGTATAAPGAPPAFDGDGEFVFMPYPHPLLHDGRGTNRPWLLENPDPVTKITWHSWVEISPATATRLDVRRGEILRLVSPHGAIEAPAYVYAGMHDEVVAMPMGFGHTAFGEFAKDRGVNALDLLGNPGAGAFVPYLSTRVRVEKTNRWMDVATTEGNPRQLGRGIAEAMPLAAAQQGLTVRQAYIAEGKGKHEINTELELEAIDGWRDAQIDKRKLGNYAEEHPAWGMAIDLSRCTGCSACVTACYAENNIPTVGYEEVLRGREMSWMRIERYWEGGTDGEPLEARFVPMLCQHCENAPCEPVCPVYAAYHTPDGLNGQVYNRCVGTRYCGNNCPYKVRYFNWYAYNQKAWPEPLNLQLNPDVTVRARGVMEKCTFCVQRIRGAQSEARLEDRPLRDGDVVTACAQACPSDAIVFGNMRDPDSRVAQVRRDHRGYHILEDINVRPAITYLAKVTHPAGV